MFSLTSLTSVRILAFPVGWRSLLKAPLLLPFLTGSALSLVLASGSDVEAEKNTGATVGSVRVPAVDGAAVVVDWAGVVVDWAGVVVDWAGVVVDGAAVVVDGAGVVVDGAGVVVDGAGVVVVNVIANIVVADEVTGAAVFTDDVVVDTKIVDLVASISDGAAVISSDTNTLSEKISSISPSISSSNFSGFLSVISSVLKRPLLLREAAEDIGPSYVTSDEVVEVVEANGDEVVDTLATGTGLFTSSEETG